MKNSDSSTSLLYRKVYNRLKSRKSRGKIDTAEWNTLVSKALHYKLENMEGRLNDKEYKRIMDNLGWCKKYVVLH